MAQYLLKVAIHLPNEDRSVVVSRPNHLVGVFSQFPQDLQAQFWNIGVVPLMAGVASVIIPPAGFDEGVDNTFLPM